MSNNVSFIFNASDRLTRPLRKMAQAAGALKNRISSLRPKLDSLSKRFAKFRQELVKTGRAAKTVGKDLFTSITLPIVLAGGFMLKAASDAVEVNQKFGVVFKSVSVEANKASADLAKGFGLSKVAAKEFLSGTGDLLTGLGFSSKAALDMSVKANQLAVDLASFTNVEGGAERAAKAMTSALLGERESLVALGIKVKEGMVQRKISILVSEGAVFTSMLQAQAAATLAIAIDQSVNAIGDFNRSQGSLANQTRIARAKLHDMSVEIGKMLIPLALKLVKLVIRLAEKFRTLAPRTKKIALFLALVAAVIPPLLILVGGLAVAFGLVTLPITLAVLAVGALIAAGIFLIFNWEKVKKKVIEVSTAIKTAVAAFAIDAAFKFGVVIGKLFDFIGVNEEVRAKVVETFNTVSTVISSAIDFAIRKIKEFIDFATPSFNKIGDTIKNAFGTSLDFIGGQFTALVTPEVAPIANKFAALAVPQVGQIAPPAVNTTISQAFQAGFGTQKSTTDVNININAPKGTAEIVDSKTRGSIDGLNLGLNMQTGTGG